MPAPQVPHPRRLIVNADDFGQSVGVNDGIIRCCEQGVVTSASLMVRWPMAAAAAEYARAGARLSVGLHLDLGEWADRDDGWTSLYEVVAPDDREAIAAEIDHQLLVFRQLMGRDPTHLDSHQHVHRWDTVAGPLRALGDTLRIHVRHASPHVAYDGGVLRTNGQAGMLSRDNHGRASHSHDRASGMARRSSPAIPAPDATPTAYMSWRVNKRSRCAATRECEPPSRLKASS